MPKSRRKNKLNEDLISEASRLVKAGLHLSHVAQALGISRQTFYNWLRKGEETQKGLEYRFYEEITKAEAEAIARNVALIQKAAQEGNWQAAAWWLERKYPEEWGRKDRVNVDTDEGIVIKIHKVGSDGSDE